MVESCSCAASSEQGFSQDCANSTQAVSFENVTEALVDNLGSGDHIARSNSKTVGSNLFQNSSVCLPTFQRFIDDFFRSVLETVDEDIMCCCIKQQENIDCYASKVSHNILQSSFCDILPALSHHYQLMSIDAYAENLVGNLMFPILDILGNGILDYASNLSEKTLQSATACAAQQIQKERVANVFAEKFSLRIFRDFFIHIITDANRIAYHLLGSYQAVSKNQLHSFAENMIENILKDIFPVEKSKEFIFDESLSEMFASSLADDILYFAIDDVNKAAFKIEKAKAASTAVEKYASQMVDSLFTNIPNMAKKTNSNCASVNLHIGYRRNSSDDHSEAITPRSVGSDSYWKRGIYHFADQLLYSLTALEDDGSDTLSELEVPVKYRKERRWGSCPHIYNRPFAVSKDFSTWRRKSETIVCIRKKLITYAEELTDVIMTSVLPSLVVERKF